MLEIALNIEQPADLPAIAEHQPAEFVCPAPRGARLALAVDGLALEPFLRPGEAAWRWRWNPGAAAGLHQLALSLRDANGDETRHSWPLRVLTRKLDQERYELLIDDLQRLTYRLVAALSGAGAEGAALERGAPWRNSPAEEFYALFETRLGAFARAVRRIGAGPREQLRGVREQAPLGQSSGLSEAAIAGLARGQFEPAPPEVAADLQAALRPGGGMLPREVAAERGRPTADIYEHRLLKHLLALLARRARAVGALAAREVARLAASEAYTGAPNTRRLRAEAIAAGCATAATTLRELRGLPFMAEVGALPAFRGATPLLQRDAAYREVYHMWQALRQQPQITFDSPLFATPIAELPRLYESWCALQVAEALLTLGWQLREQTLIAARPQPGDEAIEQLVSLSERAPLLVLARGEWALTLRYQARYRPATERQKAKRQKEEGAPFLPSSLSLLSFESLDRYTHVPDLAIELRRAGALPQVLVLDAKYRLDAEGRGVPPDALADAYTYLGAIGCAGQRATLGALLLYPGSGPPEQFASGVGALPLLPGHTHELAGLLAAWLPSAA